MNVNLIITWNFTESTALFLTQEYSTINSFNRYLLTAYYMPGIIRKTITGLNSMYYNLVVTENVGRPLRPIPKSVLPNNLVVVTLSVLRPLYFFLPSHTQSGGAAGFWVVRKCGTSLVLKQRRQ